MKKTLLYSLLVVSIAGLWSCSNDADVPVPQDEEISTRSGELVECLNITYKGKTYQNVPTSYTFFEVTVVDSVPRLKGEGAFVVTGNSDILLQEIAFYLAVDHRDRKSVG